MKDSISTHYQLGLFNQLPLILELGCVPNKTLEMGTNLMSKENPSNSYPSNSCTKIILESIISIQKLENPYLFGSSLFFLFFFFLFLFFSSNPYGYLVWETKMSYFVSLPLFIINFILFASLSSILLLIALQFMLFLFWPITLSTYVFYAHFWQITYLSLCL